MRIYSPLASPQPNAREAAGCQALGQAYILYNMAEKNGDISGTVRERKKLKADLETRHRARHFGIRHIVVRTPRISTLRLY